MESELKPCPFCGGTDIEITKDYMRGGNPFGVCIDCGTEGPTGKDIDDAVIKWNTRAHQHHFVLDAIGRQAVVAGEFDDTTRVRYVCVECGKVMSEDGPAFNGELDETVDIEKEE